MKKKPPNNSPLLQKTFRPAVHCGQKNSTHRLQKKDKPISSAIAISLITLTSCSQQPNQQVGQCNTSSLASVSPQADVAPQIIPSPVGGYLQITHIDSPTEVKKCTAFIETRDWISGAKVLKDTTVVVKDKIAALPITIWTAKHCLRVAKLHGVTFQLFVDEKKAEEPKYIDLAIDIDIASRIQSLTSKLSDLVEGPSRLSNIFESAYSYFETIPFEDIFDIHQKNNLQITSYSMDNLAPRSKELRYEKLAFGQPMCKDFQRKIGKNSNKKVCITYDDMGAYAAHIEVDKKGYLAALIKQQSIRRDDFLKKFSSPLKSENAASKPQATPMKVSPVTIHAAGWKTDFLNSNLLTIQYAYLKTCSEHNCSSESKQLFQDAFSGLSDIKDPTLTIPTNNNPANIITLATSEKVSGIIEKKIIELDTKLESWSWLTKTFFEKSPKQVEIHGNFIGSSSKEKNALYKYKSINFAATSTGKGTPLMWRTYGLIYWGQSGTLDFSKGDSGSMVSIGGVFPLATVSSVDNTPTSGGIANSRLPTLQNPSPKAKANPEEQQNSIADNNTTYVTPTPIAANTLGGSANGAYPGALASFFHTIDVAKGSQVENVSNGTNAPNPGEPRSASDAPSGIPTPNPEDEVIDVKITDIGSNGCT